MGKVRKVRQKYHLSTKKSKALNNLPEVEQKNGVEQKEHFFPIIKENVFAGIDIPWDDVDKSLPKDFDVRSTVSCKSRKEMKEEERHLKKSDKKRLRRERFIQKLDTTHKLLIRHSESKKKTKNKNLGDDMSSLLDALPSLESFQEENSKKKYEKPKAKSKGVLKAKQRLKQQSIDIKVFKHILDDKTFKENPLQAITQFLRQKVSMDR